MVLEKQKYGKWIFPVLFMLYVAWTAVGAFPLLNYESDSGNLISGVAFMRATGHVSDLWDYCYDNQPLTYWVIIAVTWLTHLGAEASYCLISWLASIALAWFAVNLIHEVCGVSRSVALFAWVLMPESYACGMYANSGVLAVMAATGGMWLLWRKKYIWATVVLCVAPLLRLDVVCIYPVVFPMLWLQGMGWKKSAVWSALLALIVIAAIVTGLMALGGSLDENFTAYGFWNGLISRYEHYKAIVAAYSIGAVAIVAGIVMLLKRHRFLLLFMLLLPIVSEHLVFSKMGCASKHYLSALPYAAGIAAFVTSWIIKEVKQCRWGGIIAVAGILLSETIGVSSRGCMSHMQEDYDPDYRVFRLRLATFDARGRKIDVEIGPGSIYGTADELMLASGNAYYPFVINKIKRNLKKRMDGVWAYLADKKDYVAETFAYLDRGFMITKVLESGGRMVQEHCYGEAINAEWRDDDKTHAAELATAGGGRVYALYNIPDRFFDREWKTPIRVEQSVLLRLLQRAEGGNLPYYLIYNEYPSMVWRYEIEALEASGYIKPVVPGLWQLTPKSPSHKKC